MACRAALFTLLVQGLVLAGADTRSCAAADGTSPYVQTGVVEAGAGHGLILGFCVPPDGGLVAVTGVKEQLGAGPRREGGAKPNAHHIVWFDADGTEARSVELDFAATAVAAHPGGGFCVAGDGTVAILSDDGEEIVRGPTPQTVKTDEQRAELEKAITEKRDLQVAMYEKQIERLRTAVAELEHKVEKAEQAVADADEDEDEDDDDEDDEESDDEDEDEDEATARERMREQQKAREALLRTARTQAGRTKQQLQQLEAQADSVRKQDPRMLVEMALRRTRHVKAISATRDAVFVVVGESSGYGYAAWRLDARLENPKKVLEKLMGCCGQTEVQVVGGRLAVANQGHRVRLCDLDGEAIGTVGTKAAAGDNGAGFGGCCNPMNTCEAPDGSLLASESNGMVKRFDADGAFVEIVGTAKVRPGCKNSAIAIEPDGSRLYYMDSAAGKVLVLTRSEDRADADDVAAADREE